MQKSSYKFNKTLVIAISIFFILTGITQNISGHDKASNINYIREAFGISPVDDNQITAYWKFDECSGDIVGDSSGNNYDGTKYGGTWTSEAITGCALDFDGIDDYIDFSPYASLLGLNKTDDCIISFYFKTTTNKTGTIFNIAGDNDVPELLVEIQPNGQVLAMLWTSCKCGLIVQSDNGYNDGEWHNVDIFYNGISLYPTLSIYIDDHLDANLTEWICHIKSENFTSSTIGKKATGDDYYFEGIIDEFKFYKYDGGNDQTPPIIEGPEIGKPNIEYQYTLTITDPENDDVSIKIDWGDGEITEWFGPFEPGEQVTFSHIWYEEGEYFIKAKSKDYWGESYWSIEGYEVKIGNQPPEQPQISGQLFGDSGKLINYTFMSYDLEGDDIYYIIFWGDGTETETDYVKSNTSIELSHIWDFNGDYYITAKAIDIKGNEGKYSEPLWIRIGDKPPRKTDIDGPISGKPNEEIDFVFEAIDPENDNVSYNIIWGDGEEISETEWFSSGAPITISYTWDNTGNYIIEVRSKDIFDYWSDWSSFNIKIPREKEVNFLFLRLLNRVPVLERILTLIK
jgi:hypothetical protein